MTKQAVKLAKLEEEVLRDLPELEFEDVKFYLEQHLKALEGDK